MSADIAAPRVGLAVAEGAEEGRHPAARRAAGECEGDTLGLVRWSQCEP
jgi:hypothetical protein